MNATSTTINCHCCRALVEGAQHLILCDGCLDARLAELERLRKAPRRRPGTASAAMRWPAAALADGLSDKLGDRLRVAA